MPILDPTTNLEVARCDKHKRYQGKGKPSSECSRCWEIHMIVHPEHRAERDSGASFDGHRENSA